MLTIDHYVQKGSWGRFRGYRIREILEHDGSKYTKYKITSEIVRYSIANLAAESNLIKFFESLHKGQTLEQAAAHAWPLVKRNCNEARFREPELINEETEKATPEFIKAIGTFLNCLLE